MTAANVIAADDRVDAAALCQCGCGQAAPIAQRTNRSRGRVKGQPMRYVKGHNGRGKRRSGPTPEERFWPRVQEATDLSPNGWAGCWVWTGFVDRKGYGSFSINNRSVRVHRFAYETVIGLIPPGLDLDHLCRRPSCVNPAHLEPVTNAENVLRGEGLSAENARKTHCIHGHLFSPENTIIRPAGQRECRECNRQGHARYRARRRASEAASS